MKKCKEHCWEGSNPHRCILCCKCNANVMTKKLKGLKQEMMMEEAIASAELATPSHPENNKTT